eukprot:CAMPEP_0170182618 /NCGR_PEP_ID=MMETSP0040_2-20121228/28374_1 /TAXON_ID=641309 /ORGANISM="Lotharella oceanica, Strain CCMP622" /LENGTH=43 /DNA_ID= /DNA_START= /DNA_END= /DNA_ORIENTATION=
MKAPCAAPLQQQPSCYRGGPRRDPFERNLLLASRDIAADRSRQ